MAEITKELGRIPVTRGEYEASITYYKDNIVQYKRGSYQVVSESPIIGVPPTNDKNVVNPGWTLFAGTLDAQDVVNQIKEQEAKSIQAVAAREAEILAKSDAAEVSFDNTGTSLSRTNVQDALEETDGKISELELEVIYDVTANNDGATFPSLSALLSSKNLSTLIPTSVRHGGMSIRFVQSSDNKYVQYRLMNQNWSNVVTDWQGVDDEPIARSNNLVKSGGVYKELYEEMYNDMPFDTNILSEKCINYKNGDISYTGNSDFNVFYWPCEKGDKFVISCYSTFSSGYASMYAIYSAENVENIGKQNCLYYSGRYTEGTYEVEITNDNAKWIAVTQNLERISVKKGVYTIKFELLDSKIEGVDSKNVYLNKYAYSYVNGNLYIAYNDGSGTEYCYWFKRCMANELFTFYRVGYRSVERNEPSIDGIRRLTDITIINSTASDNIGPLLMNDNQWVGGNHTYTPGGQKTAKTDVVDIIVDGKAIVDGSYGYCENIGIRVVNTLYDPAYAPAEDSTILSTPLASETVFYSIFKNNIELGVAIAFVSGTTNTVHTYYGMQSMFNKESHYITPNGGAASWKSVNDGDYNFTKSAYPSFNRFIEKNDTEGYLQGTYLRNIFNGTHDAIANNQNIFLRSGTKTYHHLCHDFTGIANKSIKWNGTYTFNKAAIVDANGVLSYRGVVDGCDALFISTDSAKENIIIPVPSDIRFNNISIVENYNFNGLSSGVPVSSNGIELSSQSAGSLILKFDGFVVDEAPIKGSRHAISSDSVFSLKEDVNSSINSIDKKLDIIKGVDTTDLTKGYYYDNTNGNRIANIISISTLIDIPAETKEITFNCGNSTTAVTYGIALYDAYVSELTDENISSHFIKGFNEKTLNEVPRIVIDSSYKSIAISSISNRDIHVIFSPKVSDVKYGSRLIDVFYLNDSSARSLKGKSLFLRTLNKSTGTISLRDSNSKDYNVFSTKKKGKELLICKDDRNVYLGVLVDWDIVDYDFTGVPQSEENTIVLSTPKSSEGQRIFDMFFNKKYRQTGNTIKNGDGVISEYDCVWEDGTAGHVAYTTYDANVLEYKSSVVTYGSNYAVHYGLKTFDEFGDVISETGLEIYVI